MTTPWKEFFGKFKDAVNYASYIFAKKHTSSGWGQVLQSFPKLGTTLTAFSITESDAEGM